MMPVHILASQTAHCLLVGASSLVQVVIVLVLDQRPPRRGAQQSVDASTIEVQCFEDTLRFSDAGVIVAMV